MCENGKKCDEKILDEIANIEGKVLPLIRVCLRIMKLVLRITPLTPMPSPFLCKEVNGEENCVINSVCLTLKVIQHNQISSFSSKEVNEVDEKVLEEIFSEFIW